jgi:hypothetical protein
MTRREYRCPDCPQYCATDPLTDRAYCPTHGWFDADEATHTVEVSP